MVPNYLLFIDLRTLLHTCCLVSREFCREGEFVIRTIYIAYRLYPVYSIKTCFSVSHFGDEFYYKANIAYFKPSSLPEDPTLRSELKEVMHATFTLFEGLDARMKARIQRPAIPLLNIESRDIDQTCPTCLETHRVHPHDSRVGYGSNQRHGGKMGLWDSNWRQLLLAYICIAWQLWKRGRTKSVREIPCSTRKKRKLG